MRIADDHSPHDNGPARARRDAVGVVGKDLSHAAPAGAAAKQCDAKRFHITRDYKQKESPLIIS